MTLRVTGLVFAAFSMVAQASSLVYECESDNLKIKFTDYWSPLGGNPLQVFEINNHGKYFLTPQARIEGTTLGRIVSLLDHVQSNEISITNWMSLILPNLQISSPSTIVEFETLFFLTSEVNQKSDEGLLANSSHRLVRCKAQVNEQFPDS